MPNLTVANDGSDRYSRDCIGSFSGLCNSQYTDTTIILGRVDIDRALYWAAHHLLSDLFRALRCFLFSVPHRRGLFCQNLRLRPCPIKDRLFLSRGTIVSSTFLAELGLCFSRSTSTPCFIVLLSYKLISSFIKTIERTPFAFCLFEVSQYFGYG